MSIVHPKQPESFVTRTLRRQHRRMQVEELRPDVLLVRGEAYQSIATAFLDDRKVLLVDALASDEDARELQRLLEDRGRRTVRAIVVTHYMSDHLAGLRLFASARVLAHRYYMHTYLAQRDRDVDSDAHFVRPSVTFDTSLEFSWGRHRLRLLHNPGKTLCTLAVDVPDDDLVLCGDAVVGNTVYFSAAAAPDMIGESLVRLQSLGRATIVPGHMGVFDATVLENAQHYLRTIGAKVRDLRRQFTGAQLDSSMRALRIEECLAPEVIASDFEREWHGYNLERIIERRLFFGDGP
jgi:glyoxylase-like metal-dependent hydrolase (beta-lactamase superfamily II)